MAQQTQHIMDAQVFVVDAMAAIVPQNSDVTLNPGGIDDGRRDMIGASAQR